jgi:hypothetical protein
MFSDYLSLRRQACSKPHETRNAGTVRVGALGVARLPSARWVADVHALGTGTAPAGKPAPWGLWLLVVPACRRLRAHWPQLRRLWAALPWLLWGPLALVLTFYVLGWLSDDRAQAGDRLRANLIECVADDRVSRTTQVLFRRGHQEVARQMLVPFHATAPRTSRLRRTVQVTHLVPGVQWITWLPEPANLDASWHAVPLDGRDTLAQNNLAYDQLRLSSDSALHRRLRGQARARLQGAQREWTRQMQARLRLLSKQRP